MCISSASVTADERITSLLCDKAKVPNCTVKQVRPLVEGFGKSSIYRVTTEDNHDYVIRFYGKTREMHNRKRESTIIDLAAKAGVAPKLYYVDNETGMVMDYIDHKGFQDSLQNPQETLVL